MKKQQLKKGDVVRHKNNKHYKILKEAKFSKSWCIQPVSTNNKNLDLVAFEENLEFLYHLDE